MNEKSLIVKDQGFEIFAQKYNVFRSKATLHAKAFFEKLNAYLKNWFVLFEGIIIFALQLFRSVPKGLNF